LLTIGTIVAQILPFLFYPYFSRIFSPSDFGLFATISTLIPFFAILASGTYENSILLSKDKQEAASLIVMILIRSSFILFLSWLIFEIFAIQIGELLNEKRLEKWIFIIPICSFATIIYNLFNEWCVTHKYFMALSVNKIINTSSIAIGKLLFGLSSLISNGLILGDLFGRALTAIICIIRVSQRDSFIFSRVKMNDLRSLSTKYNNFPRLYLPDQFLNLIGGSLHVFVIGIFFSSEDLGYFSLAASILTVPVTVVSSAIKDVFRQRANQYYSETGSCRVLYIKLLVPIAILTIILSIPFYYLLPKGFSVFFGKNWSRAGMFAQILLPMFVTNFISMSLGGVLLISKKYIVSLLWQAGTILLSIFAFFFGICIYNSIEFMLYFFMIARTIAYLIYIVLSYYYAANVDS
jgi:O-antigen/teichoic acid export membrane protein